MGCYLKASAPAADRVPAEREVHGERLIDNYSWLENKNDQKVVDYIAAENQYAAVSTRHTSSLQERLFEELLRRTKETDLSVPEKFGDYYYYSRTDVGNQYSVQCRKKGGLDAPEEVLIDENILSQGHDYFQLGAFVVSPDHRFLAYSIDTRGDEIFTLYIKDLTTGQVLSEEIPNTATSVAWASDSKTIFYCTQDDLKRASDVYSHRLGADRNGDRHIYHEADKAFDLSVSRTRSGEYITISSNSLTTSEVRYLSAATPDVQPQVITPRKPNVQYSVEHHGGQFFILTDEQATNFKLMQVTTDDTAHGNWKEHIPHRDAVKLGGVLPFQNHLVMQQLIDGLPQIAVQNLTTGELHHINFPEPNYRIWFEDNPEYKTNILRFTYSSLVTPATVIEYNMDTHILQPVKRQDVPGYDPTLYETERIFAKAKDGTDIPISLVYRKDQRKAEGNPLLLVGYGAYGSSDTFDLGFSAERLSLLDRGFVYAIAHIRGGGELGTEWHNQGKLLNKKNTFTDFIACAEHLIATKRTSNDQLVLNSLSAGGLLLGYVANNRPDLARAIIAEVPFVDALNTILRPSLPLTVNEYEEWGNPQNKAFFDYIKSYSPYDNVKAQEYPAMLVTAGLNDPRVPYWEPLKWVAKLRSMKLDDNPLILKTDVGPGHHGPSGRYDRLRTEALKYAFILDVLGIE